jgi:hypothetical protein
MWENPINQDRKEILVDGISFFELFLLDKQEIPSGSFESAQ